MKEIITGVLIFLGTIIVVLMVADFINRAVVYDDQLKQQQMEYCISQQETFEECWLSVYKNWNYQRNAEED